MKSNKHNAARRQESKPSGGFSPKDAVLIVETEQDVDAARVYLDREAITIDQLCFEIGPHNLGSAIVVRSHNACDIANAAIESGAPRLRVMFVDLNGQTLESMVKQHATRSHLISLLTNPSDPLMHIVRPLRDWEEREPAELIGCSDGAIGHGPVWQFPSLTAWAGSCGSGKSRLAVFFAIRAMLTAEGMSKQLKASFCGFGDDLRSFGRRSVAQVLRRDPSDLRQSRERELHERLWWYDERLTTPYNLDEWMDQVCAMVTRYGVRLHFIDPLLLPCFEHGKPTPGYLYLKMEQLRLLASEQNIAIQVLAHTMPPAPDDGTIKPISLRDARGLGDLASFCDYGICVVSSTCLAKLRHGEINAANTVAAASATHIANDAHMIVAIDKVKRCCTMNYPEVYAFSHDRAADEIAFDADASLLARKIWRV